jgi:hypothetical protein
MRESEIEQYFVWAVQRMGGVTYKFRALNCKGVSDRIACLPSGATWFVELKAPNGRLSPLQRKFAEDMRARNQNYTTLWSKTEVDEWQRTITSSTLMQPNGCET